MIEIKHLSKTYNADDAARAHQALVDIDLTIDDGDVFGIIGESGAGKSTLVRCINLLERPTSGRVIIDGQDVTDLSGKQLLELRARIGMIFQNFSLFQQRSVLRNVTFPLELAGASKAEREKRAHELLEHGGAGRPRRTAIPVQLSGGQQQRVAIARALANEPDDHAVRRGHERARHDDDASRFSSCCISVNKELGVTIVLITHSMTVAEAICNRVAVIENGSIVEEGPTKEVFANPQSHMARALLGLEDVDEDGRPVGELDEFDAEMSREFAAPHAASAAEGKAE
jgi:D-methionine transport system ATP-binding protein